MTTKVLYILRGLPGSGKSTLAKKLAGDFAYEADTYHMVDGVYQFNPANTKAAHQWCHNCVSVALHASVPEVAVANTFTQRWEYQPYIALAEKFGYDVQVIECHSSWQNVHNVPPEAIERMRNRWEPHTDNRKA